MGSIATVVITGAKETIRDFELIDRSQVPWSLTLSLTRTAQKCKPAVQKSLPLHFTLRRKAFMEQGIRIEAATKTNQQAVVKDIHDFMYLQEAGGQKMPFGKYLAVPLRGARPSLRALVKDEDKPHAVMERGGYISNGILWRVTLKRGRSRRLSRAIAGMSEARWQRISIPMYALVPKADIKPRYDFEPTVEKTANQVWPEEFKKAFEQQVKWHRSGELAR